MNKTLKEVFEGMFEDKNAEEELRNSSSLEQLYNCCCKRGYKDNFDKFKMDLENLIYEINQAFGIEEDFLEKVSGGKKFSNFNKLTAGLLSLLSLGSAAASAKIQPTSSEKVNASSFNMSKLKDKKALAIGAPAAAVGIPTTIFLLMKALKKKAELKIIYQLSDDKNPLYKSPDELDKSQSQALRKILNDVAEELNAYTDQKMALPNPYMLNHAKDLYLEIHTYLTDLINNMRKENRTTDEEKYNTLENLRQTFYSKYKALENNSLSPPVPPVPPPPPLPPENTVSGSHKLKIPPRPTPTNQNDHNTSSEEGIPGEMQMNFNAGNTKPSDIAGAKKAKETSTEEQRALAERATKLEEENKQRQKEQINLILNQFKDLKQASINNRINDLIKDITRKTTEYQRAKTKDEQLRKGIINSCYELEFLNNYLNYLRNVTISNYDNAIRTIRELVRSIRNNKLDPKDPYNNVDYGRLKQSADERERKPQHNKKS